LANSDAFLEGAVVSLALKGITWNHPRGYGPLEGDAVDNPKSSVIVQWDRRTLQEFGEAPLDQYAETYDLLIVDHPFVGSASRRGILAPLSKLISKAKLSMHAKDSVGPSWESYWYDNALWALPIDAAAQVSCYRHDLLEQLGCSGPPKSLSKVIALGARANRNNQYLGQPLCPIDAICTFMTILAGLGAPPAEDGDLFVERVAGVAALEAIRSILALCHPTSIDINPIQLYEKMSASDEIVYCPYAFGYSNYCRKHRARPLTFCEIPALVGKEPKGSVLGGTGIAVSAHSAHKRQAVDYALRLCSPEHQSASYFLLGGQPASRAAWLNSEVNAASRNFFTGTLATLDLSYVRPRFAGFIPFFEYAGKSLNSFLRSDQNMTLVLDDLNRQYDLARGMRM
jgi:multiple sugar transport system substrate-binding protein